MKIIIKSDNLTEIKADLLIKPLFQKGIDTETKELDGLLNGKIAKIIKMGDFSGKEKDVCMVYTDGKLKSERLLLLGVGEIEKTVINNFRKTGARILKQASKIKAEKICIDILTMEDVCKSASIDMNDAFSAFIEGLLLAGYKYDKYKKSDSDDVKIKEVILLLQKSTTTAKYNDIINSTQIVCEAVKRARDYANAPGSDLNPVTFSTDLKSFSKKLGIKTTVLKKKEIETKKMGGLLAVSNGSSVPPRFVIMEYHCAGW